MAPKVKKLVKSREQDSHGALEFLSKYVQEAETKAEYFKHSTTRSWRFEISHCSNPVLSRMLFQPQFHLMCANCQQNSTDIYVALG